MTYYFITTMGRLPASDQRAGGAPGAPRNIGDALSSRLSRDIGSWSARENAPHTTSAHMAKSIGIAHPRFS
jgi:hypothetical protein